MNKTVDEIAGFIGGTVLGDGAVRITGLQGIKEASAGDLSFVADEAYLPYLKTTEASAILVPPGCANGRRPVIEVSDPYQAFAKLLKSVESECLSHPEGIHPTAVVGENVTLGKNVALDSHVRIADDCEIGDNVVLYSGVYVGRGSGIGADTVIYPNTTIRERITIGNRCIIHGNVAIGSDGFGFARQDGERAKIPQIGTVVIGDDVEIGSNTAIDRATCGVTTIGDGTKIDNLVQIAHNVTIGKHCTLCAKVGIAGSVVIGDNVTFGGGALVNGHIEVGDNVTIGGFSGVTKSVEAGQVVSGFPAIEHEKEKRVIAVRKRLPEALRRIAELERRIEKLEE